MTRVTLVIEGGFAAVPGLAAPVTVEDERTTELAAACAFFSLPAEVGAPRPGAADYLTYHVTGEDGTRTHTVRAVEPVPDAGLRDLIAYLQSRR